jgi:hypothetical protein
MKQQDRLFGQMGLKSKKSECQVDEKQRREPGCEMIVGSTTTQAC